MNNEIKETSAPDAYAQAMAFMAEVANGDNIPWDDFRDRTQALPEPVQREIAALHYYYDRRKLEKELASKELGPEKRVASPSGKYELGVATYEGSDDRRVVVYQKDGDGWKQLPFVVQRNGHGFPHLFIEGHTTGHDFLVCAEDYQGSTVLELDTGRRRDHAPYEILYGWGFCWVSHIYDAASQLLIVDGCIWACPWEFRFYDFSDPMEKGWPQLTVIENGEPRTVDADARQPLIEGTKITVYDTGGPEGDEVERVLKAAWTFERVDNTLILQSEWASEREQQARKDRAEAERIYEDWKTAFKATDPLYVLLTERTKDWPGSTGPYTLSIGVVHDRWCPTYKSPGQKERRVGRKVVHIKKRLEAEIEWGVETGPIRADVTVDGKARPTRWFMEHSTTAMTEALDYVEIFLERSS
jgi:hypothetical protein